MILTLECVGCYVSMATFSEALNRTQHSVSALVLVGLLLAPWTTVLTDKLPIVYDQPIVNLGSLDVVLDNCSGNAPFSEETFRLCLPPPPNFTLPPPPPFISGDCGDTYSWQLVRNSIASSADNNNAGDCSEQFVQRIVTPPDTASTPSTSAHPLTTKRPNRTRQARLNDTDRGGEQVGGEEKEKEIDATNERGRLKEEVVQNRKVKINQKIPKVKTPKAMPDLLADVTTCANDESCNSKGKEERKKPRRIRGLPGPPGPQGAAGPPGAKGIDGLPGLVVFPDAAAMFGVSLEGLIAYRKDVKQLFVRDHLTWRPIRVAKCGDGIVDRDAGEQCDDGNDDIHDDCFGCRRSSCGDGIRNRRTEECDGRDFGDRTCTTYRDGLTGPLTCTPECQISYQRCRHKRYLRR